MPPVPGQKGTGKKGSGAKPPRSRNTTPMSSLPTAASIPPIEVLEIEYLQGLRLEYLRPLTNDDLVDHAASNGAIPDSRTLETLHSRLKDLDELIERRGSWSDKAMRQVAMKKKDHIDEAPSTARSHSRKDGAEDADKKLNKKKRKANDSLAPGDQNTERSSPLRDSNSKPRKASRDSTSSSLSPVAQPSPGGMDVDDKMKLDKNKEEEEEEESSEDEGAPPRRVAPQFQTFGEDPSTFPDPTVYEILPVRPVMTDDERKELYSVAAFPKSDLADRVAGEPPDKDFSNAKPTNQISFSTFSTHIEPFFRPFGEEDLAFLRERGDRVTPFVMPKKGKRHYTEVWAEEDGTMAIDSPPLGRDKLAPNQPRGTIENMDDDVAETDKLSVGPVLARLLQAMRPEARSQSSDDKPMTNGVNGDMEMRDEANGEVNGNAQGDESKVLPPATFMPESSGEAWKKSSHPKLDYSQVDERIRQEFRFIGWLPLDTFEADYDNQFDDQVSARLRELQTRLKEQMLINGARKARLTDLVKERLAHQEYQTILEDLDTQVQGAYLKRTRTMGKSKKAKRPGGAGGGSHAANAAAGMARPGIGDVTKTLMERRSRWISSIGPVFDDESLNKVPRISDPDSTIFKPEIMNEFLKNERQTWDEEVDEE